MKTVLWFSISDGLSNREIGERLDSTVLPESDETKNLVLFRRGDAGVACRVCPTVLKVFATAPELISAAQRSFGKEVGES